MAHGVFAHGVASGDPTPHSVVLWTRVSGASGEPVPVDWSVERLDGGPVATGTGEAAPGRDWTVHVDLDGLEPATAYRYRFSALGEGSPTGVTRTLPGDGVSHLRFAQLSCAKFNAGFFNGYARVAERAERDADLDFVLHLGDYIYEASQTPPASQTPGADIGRPFDPLHECRTLDDYRRRYAQYRSDPDVQRLHAVLPMIATLDDHEFADGAWRGGATEHREERDGPWLARVDAAFQARWEWLPARPPDPADPRRVFRQVHFGSLADLFLLDTRSRRDEPVPPPAMLAPERSALGAEQHAWLFDALAASRARWRLIGNPSVLARTWNDSLPAEVKQALVKVKLIDTDGTGPDWDQWDGYPAERAMLLRQIANHSLGNVVVLSADVHVSLAIELLDAELSGRPVAVEFVNTSLTSQNLDDKMGWTPRQESLPVEAAFLAGMPHVRWCDFDSHGYSIVDLSEERLTFEWWVVEGILERRQGERQAAAFEVRAGEPRLRQIG